MSAPTIRSRKFGKKQQNEHTLHYRNRKKRKLTENRKRTKKLKDFGQLCICKKHISTIC